MTDSEHTLIYDKHSEVLHKLDKKLDLLSVRFENTEDKLDSLETRFDNLHGLHSGDLTKLQFLIRGEIEKIETKFENKISDNFKRVHERIDKHVLAIQELEKFNSNIAGKAYGLMAALAGAFTVISFVVNKFL